MTVREPGASQATRTDAGTATAQFTDLGGNRLRLVVSGSARGGANAELRLEGEHEGGRWNGRSNSLSMAIAPDGSISGDGLQGGNRMQFSGTVSATHLQLRVQVAMQQQPPGKGAPPPGSTLAFDYRLGRANAQGNAQAAAPKAGQKDCRRIVWRVRNVTTPLGGMQMIRVPHCVK